MKKNILFLLLVLIYCSCSTTSPVGPSQPEIDFKSVNYFTPAEIRKYRGSLECDGQTPYWEGKTIRLQGFIFSGNVNTIKKSFFLYETNDLASSTNTAIVVYYQSKDSATISKALLDNKDKHCIMRVTCLTGQAIIDKCERFINFTITNFSDLDFK
jgi:hypothetical protein